MYALLLTILALLLLTSTTLYFTAYDEIHQIMFPPSPSCQGICSLPSSSPDLLPNSFASCAPRDPSTLYYVRIMKTASTRFMSLAQNLRSAKIFKLKEHRDWSEAVAQSSKMDEWDTRRIMPSKSERSKWYGELVSAVKEGTPKTLHFAHTFLPPFPTPPPTIITFLKNPVHRLSSAYNYVRHGAQTPQIRQRNIEKLGSATLTKCFENVTCSEINNLRKHCSLQALSLCGVDSDCDVHWHLVDSSNFEVKLDKMISRAVKNLESEILIAGVTEDMEVSLELIESLLPTYFEGMAALSSSETERKKNETIEFDRSWESNKNVIVSNKAKKYEKPTKEAEEAMLKDICYADWRVWMRARDILKERRGVCEERKNIDDSETKKNQEL